MSENSSGNGTMDSNAYESVINNIDIVEHSIYIKKEIIDDIVDKIKQEPEDDVIESEQEEYAAENFCENDVVSPEGNIDHCLRENVEQCAQGNVDHCAQENVEECAQGIVEQSKLENDDQCAQGNITKCKQENVDGALENIEQNVLGNVKQCAQGDIKQCAQGNVERSTQENVDGALGNIEQTVLGNVEECAQGNVERFKHENVDQCALGNIEQTVVGNVKQCAQGNIKQCAQANVERSTQENVAQGNIKQCVLGNVEECAQGIVKQSIQKNDDQCAQGNIKQCEQGSREQCSQGNVEQSADVNVKQCVDENVVQHMDEGEDGNVDECADPIENGSLSPVSDKCASESEKCSQIDVKEEEQADDCLAGSFRYYKPGETECHNGNTDDLRVFQVLDECIASDDDEQTGDGSDTDISYEEIEAMLEESLKNNPPKGKLGSENTDENGIRYTEHNALILEELGHNHFDMLPEGWIQVTHKSGMPIYLHKGSRVCTFSRPYYLGQGSVRKHNVPLNAIPCLQYRRALEEEEKKKETEVETNPMNNGQQYLHTAKIETTEENKLSQSLNALAIQQYCKKLFRFKKEQRLHFDSWADRRKYAKAKKNEKEQHRPSFPDGTKLIKFPIQNPEDGPKAKPRGEWIMNPNGKSYICILHEYVQHALKKQPTYEFKALENPSTPYSATVIINDMRYGYGTGTSKKQAKLAAAKASLEILIPEMREKIRSDNKQGKRSGVTNFPDEEETSLSIFDEIKIEDPRVAEFCAKTTEPSPYSILLTCLQRNFGLKEMPIDYKVNPLHRQSNEFIMTVGKHTARVICKNKKEGKQRASQAILQDLHPHITSWGALLRLYGNRSVRNVKEKKQEEQEITMLQSKASLNSPNYSIINKLRSEMQKLHEQKMKVRPIGVFIPPAEVNLPSSGTELDKVDF